MSESTSCDSRWLVGCFIEDLVFVGGRWVSSPLGFCLLGRATGGFCRRGGRQVLNGMHMRMPPPQVPAGVNLPKWRQTFSVTSESRCWALRGKTIVTVPKNFRRVFCVISLEISLWPPVWMTREFIVSIDEELMICASVSLASVTDFFQEEILWVI